MKKTNIIFLLGISALLTPFSVITASEILCTLGTSATSTGCVAVENNFVVFAPSATPVAGTYNAVQSVVLSAEGATSIHYTQDGTTPPCSSISVYSAPVSVKKTQTIKAIACYPQNTESAISSFEYLLSIFDAGSENASLSAQSAGTASFPNQATSLRLGNATVLDISSSVSTTSAGQIIIGGNTKTLTSFTSGNLSAVNLSAPIAVGGQFVSVEKAVAIQSGVSGEPMLLSNQDFSSANVSIPDGATVLAPSGWNGTIAPPRAAARSGAAPSGFSLGGTIVEVGSETETLLFDKPVSIVLSGVTGAVGYKAASSTTWIQIANQCAGTYAAPSAPVFPGECYISDGTNTKIHTYHFTSFAGLDAESASAPANPGGNGPVGGVGVALAGDINGDARVDILDFNLLFAAWGAGQNGPFYSSIDLNRDGAIDILDFNMLMANWK